MDNEFKTITTLSGWTDTHNDGNGFVTVSANEEEIRKYFEQSSGWSSNNLRKRTLTIDGVKITLFFMVSQS